MIAILDLKSGLFTLFTKKCYILHCNVVMKVTNEKKGIFSFYSHDRNKNFNESISVTVDLMFQLKPVNNQ